MAPEIQRSFIPHLFTFVILPLQLLSFKSATYHIRTFVFIPLASMKINILQFQSANSAKFHQFLPAIRMVSQFWNSLDPYTKQHLPWCEWCAFRWSAKSKVKLRTKQKNYTFWTVRRAFEFDRPCPYSITIWIRLCFEYYLLKNI